MTPRRITSEIALTGLRPGPAGGADAMDVIFGDAGQLENSRRAAGLPMSRPRAATSVPPARETFPI